MDIFAFFQYQISTDTYELFVCERYGPQLTDIKILKSKGFLELRSGETWFHSIYPNGTIYPMWLE